MSAIAGLQSSHLKAAPVARRSLRTTGRDSPGLVRAAVVVWFVDTFLLRGRSVDALQRRRVTVNVQGSRIANG